MSEFDVSIAVIHRNLGRYLGNALWSVLAQELGDLRAEILILDDASDDALSRAVFAGLKAGFIQRSDIVFVDSSTRCGVACTRNKALSVARGNVLMFVDADDCIGPNFVRLMYDRIAAFPQAVWAAPQVYVRTFDRLTSGEHAHKADEIIKLKMEQAMELGSMSAYRVEMIRQIGGWSGGIDMVGFDEAGELGARLWASGMKPVVVKMDVTDSYHYLQRARSDGENRRSVRRLSLLWMLRNVGNNEFFPLERLKLDLEVPPLEPFLDLAKSVLQEPQQEHVFA